MKLIREFYARPTLTVARDLLGQVLVHRSPQGTCAGRVVETEAYTQNDPACHAYRGKTKRNATMFGQPGQGYIYLIYGIHHCFNVVTAQEDVGEAVLIRALEPLAGVEIMKKRRNQQRDRLLCSGPARLCQALGITTALDGIDLLGDRIFLLSHPRPQKIVTTTRIGISQGKELPYRFYIGDSKYISKK